MLKIYEYRGQKYQFEEGEQPAGAVEAKKKKVMPPEKVAEEPEAKAAAPKTKARKPSNKSRKAVTK